MKKDSERRAAMNNEATAEPETSATTRQRAKRATETITETVIVNALVDEDKDTASSGTRTTFAQFQRYKEFLREQEEEKGSFAFI